VALTDLISADVDSIFSGDFARTVTHHYGGGSTETIRAIFTNPYERIQLGAVEIESATPGILIKTSESGNIDRDTSYFTIGSTTYHIIEMGIDEDGIIFINLSQDDE